MITVQPGGQVLATQTGLPAGLVGQLIVAILTDTGAFVTSWITAGITEVPAGSGSYLAQLEAPATHGEYVVVWDRQLVGLNPQRSEGLLVTVVGGGDAPVDPDAIPDLAEVEALLRARTLVKGTETGTFSDETRPTADQVVELIETAASDIAGRVGVTIAGELVPLARELAAVRAALLVEQAYYPEQTGDDDTAFQQLLAQFNTGIVELIRTARTLAGAGTRLA